MKPKYLIQVFKNFNSVQPLYVQTFEDTQAMEQYIQKKTMAGMVCHKFVYDTTYVLQNQIVTSPVN